MSYYFYIYYYVFDFFVFFFFQAEDGIRDTSVTGVQTCALPISRASPVRAASGSAVPSETPLPGMPCGRRGNPDTVATRPAAAPVDGATGTRRGSIRPTKIVSLGFTCCSNRSRPRPSAHCWVTNATVTLPRSF